METISQMLQSPAWWISTVVVALVINLFSTYLWGKFIDKWLSGMSEKRRKRLEEENSAYWHKVEELSKDNVGLLISFIRSYCSLVVSIVIMSAISVMAFVGAQRHSTTLDAIGMTSLIFLFIPLALLSLSRTIKALQMSRHANALRIKMLREEKGTKPPATSAKRDSNKSVSRS